MCVIFNIQQVFRIEGVIPFGSMFPTTASLGKFYNRLSILITVFITGKFSKKALLLPRNCGVDREGGGALDCLDFFGRRVIV